MAKRPTIRGHETARKLREALHYDPGTGLFTRLRTASNNARAGQIAGWKNGRGYIYIKVLGSSQAAHRLAWLYMIGDWPQYQVDHVNGDRTDNRWSNLREASCVQNAANCKTRSDNSSGAKGVRKMRGRWQVRLGSGGRYHVGTFDTYDEAIAAYRQAAREIYGEFARAA